jgi:hypothetical protein
MDKTQRALYDKQRYLKNQEERKNNALKYYYDNKEYKLEYQRYYYFENEEQIKKYNTQYQKTKKYNAQYQKTKKSNYGVLSRRKKIEKNLKNNQNRVEKFKEQLENAKE